MSGLTLRIAGPETGVSQLCRWSAELWRWGKLCVGTGRGKAGTHEGGKPEAWASVGAWEAEQRAQQRD